MDLSGFTNRLLYKFFLSNKTRMSYMETPEMFVNHLCDHGLVEEKFKKVMKSKMKNKRVYEILDNLTVQSKKIKTFWSCVFKKHMLQQYPTLQELYNELESKKLEKGQQNVIRKRSKDNANIPVKCGRKYGMLNKEKLAKGEKCIMVGNTCYHPIEFEEFGGKGNRKNWKSSIRYRGKPLLKLFKEGHLSAPRQKRRPKMERTSS
ncbi:nuclear autoantigen Sp-100-like isoform X2 [Denticeps clupeoides]|uniref:nuclear autoantigen Sp-100-like isoform X2 n=1 Tax=Denticeps clupeoides TaxID=299321 RepID=UPI0010A39DCD|nr:nuclear autoantigen Sp-100-like isoform X2 [Denticeps clupeoides]